MKVQLLLVSALFLTCSAEKNECTETDGCALARNPDSVSLLQSRGVEIEHAEGAADLKPADSTEEAEPKQSEIFVLGQRVERRDDKSDNWAVGIITSVHPLRVTAGDDPEEFTTGYEWAEVRALPEANYKGMAESERLTRQLWAQAIQSGWSTGIAAVLFVAIIYILHKLRVEKRERLEKRVHDVLSPQGVTEYLAPQDLGQEPPKYTRNSSKKQEASAFGAPEPEESQDAAEDNLVGVNRYLRGLPKAMKDQLEDRVRSALTPKAAEDGVEVNADEVQAQCEPQECAAY